MLYSKSNYSKDRKALKLNSYYENYMKDAVHSGIRKFNLIPIKKEDSLIINLDNSILSKVEEVELIYYYFTGIQEELYVNIERNPIQRGVIVKRVN
ncbi:MAG: hypothetical protein RBT46_03665 [Weeksellaceae bacterium]|jgi:hypothetical protein|nr:hypothetical protein [Weeksellaceae bacterium]MDX9704788.1 hypothetical protein [Weeksellaceae bacterium]